MEYSRGGPGAGGGNEGVDEDVEGRGAEDRTDHTTGAPDLSDEDQTRKGATTEPPDVEGDDVGVPPDEEMNRET
ncbi:MAG: hypothetical protein M3389_04690 [Actinomycetota bacterium]|nr:hypothetical protein [Actinomycetota bacterium]